MPLTAVQFVNRCALPGVHVFEGHDAKASRLLVLSHIWWSALIAHGLWRRGCTVIATGPAYVAYTNEQLWSRFDAAFASAVALVKQHQPRAILAGNAAGVLLHPRTGELLHEAAGVPLVNYWWDDPLVDPPMTARGVPFDRFLDAIRRPSVTNVFWDDDVRREMAAYFGVTRGHHLPLAATPELWQSPDIRPVPMRQRTIAACFLGNHHGPPAGWQTRAAPAVLARAASIVESHLADLDRSMIDCVSMHPARDGEPADDDRALWQMIHMLLDERRRAGIVTAAASRLGDAFVLYGKGWDALGLTARAEYSGVPAAGEIYCRARASLNLFGGCVHAGLPLRPFEIALSHGLIVTAYNRELPALFDPGRECLAFRNADEWLAHLDRVEKAPHDFDAMIESARRRVLAEHTWEHRAASLLKIIDTLAA